jgi:tRNA nucleotidyltransferase (CCA-adding enzyme)
MKIKKVLEKTIPEILPNEEELNWMKSKVDFYSNILNKKIKKLNIDVQIFVGGSFAKKSLIKKESYDADIFLRFNKKYSEKEISKYAKKIIRGIKKVSKVKGSRDYYKIKVSSKFEIELIPVKKISKAKEAENVTDMSYFHVLYVNKKVKSQKILNEIKLAKAFCEAVGVYGAESYIGGFSGYSLELLILNYKTFEKFLKELSKERKTKLVIDMEKLYKKNENILLDMNGSKLISPIVLVDPTFKERNVLAALTQEKYDFFKQKAKEFLKNPNFEYFIKEKIDFDFLKDKARKEGKKFIIVKTKTKKQKGDVAGTKLKKFHNHLKKELSNYFNIFEEGFMYFNKKEGKSYFIFIRKNEISFTGPKKEDKKNVEKFKKVHTNTFEKNNRIYAIEKINLPIENFFKKWKKKNKRKIKEMSISNIKIKIFNERIYNS